MAEPVNQRYGRVGEDSLSVNVQYRTASAYELGFDKRFKLYKVGGLRELLPHCLKTNVGWENYSIPACS